MKLTAGGCTIANVHVCTAEGNCVLCNGRRGDVFGLFPVDETGKQAEAPVVLVCGGCLHDREDASALSDAWEKRPQPAA